MPTFGRCPTTTSARPSPSMSPMSTEVRARGVRARGGVADGGAEEPVRSLREHEQAEVVHRVVGVARGCRRRRPGRRPSRRPRRSPHPRTEAERRRAAGTAARSPTRSPARASAPARPTARAQRWPTAFGGGETSLSTPSPPARATLSAGTVAGAAGLAKDPGWPAVPPGNAGRDEPRVGGQARRRERRLRFSCHGYVPSLPSPAAMGSSTRTGIWRSVFRW